MMKYQMLKVLIVDDEEGITDFMGKILRLRGFSTFEALDGISALEIFKKERPHINILDIRLGNSSIDGLGVLEQIKKIDPSARCIMVTRVTDETAINKAKELGAVHYLLKPIDAKEWVGVVLEVADSILEGENNGKSHS